MCISAWSSDVCSSDLIDIVGVPTQRDTDGLALSSRNAYLTDQERKAAHALPRALGQAAARIEKGGDIADALNKAIAALNAAGFDSIDYVELRDAQMLEPVTELKQPARLLAAARLRSEEHTSELQSLMRISYAVFCLKKKKIKSNSKHKYTVTYVTVSETK